MDPKEQPWKAIEKRGLCHYPDISDEALCVVSVDRFEAPHWAWKGKQEHFRGRLWYMVIFEEASFWNFYRYSSQPFPTLEEAVQYAEKMVPPGIQWNDQDLSA